MRRLLLRAGSIEIPIDTCGPAGRVRSSGTRSDAQRIPRTSRHGFQSSGFAAGLVVLEAVADEGVGLTATVQPATAAATTAIAASRRLLTATQPQPQWIWHGSCQRPERATSFFLPK